MSSIFGGSQSQQSSSNQAYPQLSQSLSGGIANGGNASNALAGLLGLNGGSGQDAAFQKFRDSTGYQFGMNQGMQSITGNAATQGLLNSGGTLKAMDTFGQNYANTQYQNYLNPLQSLLSSGLQGAGVLAGAGQTSQGTSSSNNGGAGKFIGSLLAK